MNHLLDEAKNSKQEAPAEDTLKRISAYAQEFTEISEEVKLIEAQLKEKKQVLNRYSQELLPEAMLSVDMTSFQLASGKMVSIKEQLSCSVKDYDKLYDFLEDRGDDAIMKIAIELGKLPKSILALITKSLQENFDLLVEPKMSVHPQTLKSYFTRLCGIGGKTETEVALVELPEDMVGTFTYYKTTVK